MAWAPVPRYLYLYLANNLSFVGFPLFKSLNGLVLLGGHFVQLCDNRDIPLIFLQNSSLSNPDELASDAIVLKVGFYYYFFAVFYSYFSFFV